MAHYRRRKAFNSKKIKVYCPRCGTSMYDFGHVYGCNDDVDCNYIDKKKMVLDIIATGVTRGRIVEVA